MNILVFDTETTGIPKHPSAKMEVQPRVIELGAALVNELGEVGESVEWLVDPEEPLEAIITKITGLTDDDLAGKPKFADLFDEVAEFFGKADAVVAHNLPFDSTLLDLEAERLGKKFSWPSLMVCTVQENAERWGRRPKLTELYEEVAGKPLEQTHRALDDVLALVYVAKETGVLHAINTAFAHKN